MKDDFILGVFIGVSIASLFITVFNEIFINFEGKIKSNKQFILNNSTYKCYKTNELIKD